MLKVLQTSDSGFEAAFEELCREWTARFAGESTLAGTASAVLPGVVSDRSRRESHQVDVVAVGDRTRSGKSRVLLLGKAKLGRRMGPGALARLRHVRTLLEERRDLDLSDCRVACFSAEGFEAALRGEARRGEVALVGLDRLYRGA